MLSPRQAEGYHVTDSIEFQKAVIHINKGRDVYHAVSSTCCYPHMATATRPHEEHVLDTHVFQGGSDRSSVTAWRGHANFFCHPQRDEALPPLTVPRR